MTGKAGGFDRRTFLRAASGGMLGVALPAARPAARQRAVPEGTAAVAGDRRWLGRAYWANRLQDWRLAGGRFECVAPRRRKGLRTVGVLTRDLLPGDLSAQLTVRTGTLATGLGFSGFLIGVGGGGLDYRAAALAQAASGTSGGLLCVYEADGNVRFREHTNETNQLAYASQPLSASTTARRTRSLSEQVELRLTITSTGSGIFDVTLVAVDAVTGAQLSSGTLSGVADTRLVGGVSLVSSPATDSAARHWLASFSASGAKVAVHEDRALGPIVGTLFTVASGTFKCTTQFMPIGPGDPQTASIEFRRVGTETWTAGPVATIGTGYIAMFRVDGWDALSDWEYRVNYGLGTPLAHTYYGRVAREPIAGTPLTVAMLNCTIHSYRSLDVSTPGNTRLPGGRYLGLYTQDNLYFPHAATANNLIKVDADMVVALGDQFYENRPTLIDPSPAPVLDSLYRYYLWMWSFRDLTATTPCVVLVDDHDMYQGNLWGHAGAAAPSRDFQQGGYVKDPSWVNVMQAIQCGHNPDPYDARPVLNGISVYYASFTYGGVNFAVLEDRKWKTGDADGLDQYGNPYSAAELQLLGQRQEQFLSAWASSHPGLPRVCITQTLLACLQTEADGRPSLDHDSNGYPSSGRDVAVQLLRSASALVLCGDQHLGAVVRHGVSSFTDGPVQFMSPALGAGFSRWFEPASTLPNGTGLPHTGDWTDGFGNKLRVLAVANPVVSRKTYAASYGKSKHDLGDRGLKREGFGVVRIDPVLAEFRLECWPWNADATSPTAQQYAGWPLSVPFADL